MDCFSGRGMIPHGVLGMEAESIKRVIGVFLYLPTQPSRYMSTPFTTQCKDNYKIRNRKDYTKSLCQRGSLSLWLEDSVMEE
ncbi:hypothetical protein EZS27_009309 [termite gut metagenome]|uniref:Uncharacterized protein n=1 Tax=termite gut metagenome TaxID=433724 RepID=A0A5J4SBX9_9ZZZZ